MAGHDVLSTSGGGGTCAASREMNVIGSSTTAVLPFRQTFLNR